MVGLARVALASCDPDAKRDDSDADADAADSADSADSRAAIRDARILPDIEDTVDWGEVGAVVSDDAGISAPNVTVVAAERGSDGNGVALVLAAVDGVADTASPWDELALVEADGNTSMTSSPPRADVDSETVVIVQTRVISRLREYAVFRLRVRRPSVSRQPHLCIGHGGSHFPLLTRARLKRSSISYLSCRTSFT